MNIIFSGKFGEVVPIIKMDRIEGSKCFFLSSLCDVVFWTIPKFVFLVVRHTWFYADKILEQVFHGCPFSKWLR